MVAFPGFMQQQQVVSIEAFHGDNVRRISHSDPAIIDFVRAKQSDTYIS
jgi:uncharacterized Rossmann fold enzyme